MTESMIMGLAIGCISIAVLLFLAVLTERTFKEADPSWKTYALRWRARDDENESSISDNNH